MPRPAVAVFTGSDSGALLGAVAITSALALFAAVAVADGPLVPAAAVVGMATVGALAHRTLFEWRMLLAAILLVILFVPIRRYEMPGHLPFELEPYRLLVAAVAGGWLSALLVDPRVRFRRSFLDSRLVLILVVCALSVVANGSRVGELAVGDVVAKKLTFLLSYLLVFFLILSVVRTLEEIDFLVRVLVAAGAAVAAMGVVEFRTGYNVFDHLASVIPVLQLVDIPRAADLARGGHSRVLASSQHPIALGAMLVMLVPLALYLALSTGRKRWWIAGGLLGIGALATLSRTGVLMMLVVVLVYLWLRRDVVKRFSPLLVPAIICAQLLVPGSLGTIRGAFFPEGGLVAQQENAAVGSGRISSLRPGLAIVGGSPVLGIGYGTRVVDGPKPNSFIVDNGWLSTAMETGVAGVVAWLALFTGFIRKLGREARRDTSERGWLAVALAASTAAFAVGMLTYDAFSFIQTTFVMVILLALGASVLAVGRERTRP